MEMSNLQAKRQEDQQRIDQEISQLKMSKTEQQKAKNDNITQTG